MTHLLYKELKLSVHPTTYLFFLMASMLLIPNYPYYVAFFYQTLGIFFIFLHGNTNNDVTFTTLLPIRKRDAVKARLITIVIIEMVQIIVSIPFAILRTTLIPGENGAGMEANAALFGLVFVMFGIFNVIFLPLFYQTAYKTGAPYIYSCLGMSVFVILVEAAIQLVPSIKTALDTTNPAFLPHQAVVLIVGSLLYWLFSFLAYAESVKRFEKIDL